MSYFIMKLFKVKYVKPMTNETIDRNGENCYQVSESDFLKILTNSQIQSVQLWIAFCNIENVLFVVTPAEQ